MSAETLLTFLVASTLLSLSPGPDNLFVLTQSALHGRRAGILITLGLCTGLLLHTMAVALGVAAIFLASAAAFTVLKLTGAAYLLYLAWLAFRAAGARLDLHGSSTLTGMALYRRGIIMNITNPKVAIFFLAFLPQFASPAHGAMTRQLILLGLLFIVVALVVFSLLACLAGVLAHWFQNSPKSQLIMNRIAGVVFVALAVRLATSRAL
ncbi:MAG: LysE family translocator [Pseudohongiellaceae bacterium]